MTDTEYSKFQGLLDEVEVPEDLDVLIRQLLPRREEDPDAQTLLDTIDQQRAEQFPRTARSELFT